MDSQQTSHNPSRLPRAAHGRPGFYATSALDRNEQVKSNITAAAAAFKASESQLDIKPNGQVSGSIDERPAIAQNSDVPLQASGISAEDDTHFIIPTDPSTAESDVHSTISTDPSKAEDLDTPEPADHLSATDPLSLQDELNDASATKEAASPSSATTITPTSYSSNQVEDAQVQASIRRTIPPPHGRVSSVSTKSTTGTTHRRSASPSQSSRTSHESDHIAKLRLEVNELRSTFVVLRDQGEPLTSVIDQIIEKNQQLRALEAERTKLADAQPGDINQFSSSHNVRVDNGQSVRSFHSWFANRARHVPTDFMRGTGDTWSKFFRTALAAMFIFWILCLAFQPLQMALHRLLLPEQPVDVSQKTSLFRAHRTEAELTAKIRTATSGAWYKPGIFTVQNKCVTFLQAQTNDLADLYRAEQTTIQSIESILLPQVRQAMTASPNTTLLTTLLELHTALAAATQRFIDIDLRIAAHIVQQREGSGVCVGIPHSPSVQILYAPTTIDDLRPMHQRILNLVFWTARPLSPLQSIRASGNDQGDVLAMPPHNVLSMHVTRYDNYFHTMQQILARAQHDHALFCDRLVRIEKDLMLLARERLTREQFVVLEKAVAMTGLR